MARLPRIDDLRGVLLDVDGTLYSQRPLRLRMAAELLRLPLQGGLGAARRTWRAIGAFRRTVEELRGLPPGGGLARLRFERAAERARLPVDEVRAIVTEWLHVRPLPRLAACARPGMREFVAWCAARGLRVGVLSDYPAAAKLEALGIARAVKLRLATIDPDIDALKPDPAGFVRACTIWQLPAHQVLYVGDRVAVDARGARGAGLPCAILGRSGIGRGFAGVRGFAELQRALSDG